jgi:hypothetical protein
MQFLVPDNNVLNKLDDFKSQQTNIGFFIRTTIQGFKTFSYFCGISALPNEKHFAKKQLV